MKTNFEKRKIRVRSKIKGTSIRPRLCVFKSNKFISAQIINDEKGETIVSINDRNLDKISKIEKDGVNRAKELGKLIAEKAIKKKIKKIVFDKGGYKYHGKIKAVADGAREGGLEF